MADCRNYRFFISMLLDDEINAEEEAQLREHLVHCDSCAAYFEVVSSLTGFVTEDCELPPVNLYGKIMAQISDEATVKAVAVENERLDKVTAITKRSNRIGAVLSLAACLVLIIGGGTYYVRTQNGMNKAAEVIQSVEEMVMEPAAFFGGNSGSTDALTQESVAADTVPEEKPAAGHMTTQQSDGSGILANVSNIAFFYGEREVHEFTMNVGDEPLTLSTKISPLSIHDPATLTSSNPEVLIVTDNGDGTCSVVARSAGNAEIIAGFAGFQFRCKVFVVNEGGFSIDIGIYAYGSRVYDITIPLLSSIALSAAVDEGIDTGDGAIHWDTQDDRISLSPYGGWGVYVTGEKVGTTYVFAEINGMKCKCTVRVFKPETE